jgi:hypothetical protein
VKANGRSLTDRSAYGEGVGVPFATVSLKYETVR